MNTISVVPGRGKMSKAEAIFHTAFNPRSTKPNRSVQYMQGAYAALINAASVNDTDFKLNTCPYNPGTSAFDAWHAGAERGRTLWRVNGGGL